MLSPGQLKRGQIIEIDGDPCLIENITVQTPSSRGAGTLWKVRARNLRHKRKVDVTYKGGETIVEPNFEKRPVQFLFSDASGLHFMDLESYDQFALRRDAVEEEAMYIVDGTEGLSSLVLDGEVIGIELPQTVELRIAECDPAAKGNSATGRTKPARLETGLTVQVPEHFSSGEVVRVETSSGKFLGRATKA
jgi:elongation factor P